MMFEKKKLDPNDYKQIGRVAFIARIALFPVLLLLRIYFWVIDYNYYDRIKGRE